MRVLPRDVHSNGPALTNYTAFTSFDLWFTMHYSGACSIQTDFCSWFFWCSFLSQLCVLSQANSSYACPSELMKFQPQDQIFFQSQSSPKKGFKKQKKSSQVRCNQKLNSNTAILFQNDKSWHWIKGGKYLREKPHQFQHKFKASSTIFRTRLMGLKAPLILDVSPGEIHWEWGICKSDKLRNILINTGKMSIRIPLKLLCFFFFLRLDLCLWITLPDPAAICHHVMHVISDSNMWRNGACAAGIATNYKRPDFFVTRKWSLVSPAALSLKVLTPPVPSPFLDLFLYEILNCRHPNAVKDRS